MPLSRIAIAELLTKYVMYAIALQLLEEQHVVCNSINHLVRYNLDTRYAICKPKPYFYSYYKSSSICLSVCNIKHAKTARPVATKPFMKTAVHTTMHTQALVIGRAPSEESPQVKYRDEVMNGTSAVITVAIKTIWLSSYHSRIIYQEGTARHRAYICMHVPAMLHPPFPICCFHTSIFMMNRYCSAFQQAI